MEIAEAAVAVTVANGLAQAGLTGKHRLHRAVFGEDGVLRGAVPVNLAVKVVAVQTLRGRTEKVTGFRSTSRHGRNQSQYVRCNRVDPCPWELVSGELSAPGAVSSTR